MPVLEAKALCKYYRQGMRAEVRALDGVSLTITAGSFTVATGPSGSGKTTLLALVGALDRPTRGEVLFDGRDLGQFSDAERTRVRRRMGFIFQSFALVARLPAWENVTYPLIPRGVSRSERLRRATELLTRLGLGDRMHARPEELSGGEQQRIAIARAFAGDPEFILADEPTSNLDAQTAEIFVTLLHERHAGGATVFMASHDPRLIDAADMVHRLEAGRLLESRADETKKPTGRNP
jgi:putative ABC transport system ATP-binding protein